MSVPTTRQMESPSAVMYLCLSDLGRERGAVASWGRPVHSAPTPAVPGACAQSPLTPAQDGAFSGREQRHPCGRGAERHSSHVCRALHTHGWWCNTSHCTGTKCFVSGLKIGAQARRHLFYISYAYECKHWSLKVIFTNVLPVAEFPGLTYHEGDTSDARSTPCCKAN